MKHFIGFVLVILKLAAASFISVASIVAKFMSGQQVFSWKLAQSISLTNAMRLRSKKDYFMICERCSYGYGFLLFLAATSGLAPLHAQTGADVGIFVCVDGAPLTQNCARSGVCLPDGRMIRIFWDANVDGPDANDQLWPTSNCNFNEDLLNGSACLGQCGTSFVGCYSDYWHVNVVPSPPMNRFYLRVYCADGLNAQYVSEVQTIVTGPQEILLSFENWDCVSECTPSSIRRCCYNNNSSCQDVTHADCDALGGTWDPSTTCAVNPCPLVHLLCPNTEEIWWVTDLKNITWTSQGFSGNVAVAINRNYPSGVWENIVTGVPNSGYYPWTVTGPPTVSARIRITSVSFPNVSDLSDALFTINPTSICVLYPNGGEIFPEGGIPDASITWTSSLPEDEYVSVWLNYNFPNGNWMLEGSQLASIGVFTEVGGYTTVTTKARVRVTGVIHTAVDDASDANFIVSASPPPAGGCLVGVVRAHGLPLAGAIVSLPSINRSATTDLQGLSLIDNLSPGTRSVQVTHSGFVSYSTNISVAAGQYTLFRPSLLPEAIINVTIQDESHRAIEGATVTTRNGPTQTSCATNFTGQCALYVAPGLYSLRVTKEGYLEQTSPLSVTQSVSNITIQMAAIQLSLPTYVFLVRGIFMMPESRGTLDDGGTMWEPLSQQLSDRYGGEPNFHIRQVAIDPTDWLDNNVARLQDQIDLNIAEPNARIILIGHSMGGIICRGYVALGNRPVEQLYTIDTPHCGSGRADLTFMIHNCCYFLWPLNPVWWPDLLCGICNEMPYPAYVQMTTLEDIGMPRINADWHALEQTKSTTYYIISSTMGSSQGDAVVSLNSQRGYDTHGKDIFADFGSRVFRRDPLLRNNSECSGFWCFHAQSPEAQSVRDFITNSLNMPSWLMDGGTTRNAASVEPEPQTIREISLMLAPYEQRLDTMVIPSLDYIQLNMTGQEPAVPWALISPTGSTYGDSTSFANVGGSFLCDVTTRQISANLPTPSSGAWVVRTQNAEGDTATITFNVTAPVPLSMTVQAPETIIPPGNRVSIQAILTSTYGVTRDSVVMTSPEGLFRMCLNRLGDSLWTGLTDTMTTGGMHRFEVVAYGHAGSERYQIQTTTGFTIGQSAAQVAGNVVWQVVDSDGNGLYNDLFANIPIQVDQIAHYRLYASLRSNTRIFISAAQADDSLEPGMHMLSLHFSGKQISDARINAPLVLGNVRLYSSSGAGNVLLSCVDSTATTDYSSAQFDGRPGSVQNVAALRAGTALNVFWTRQGDPDIAFYKIYYDTDGQPPYSGIGLMEGPSPISIGDTNAVCLHNADSSQSYNMAVTAVDSSGSESALSLPYTVFAASPPSAVSDVTIQITADQLRLQWSAALGGARYVIEVADAPDGPWTSYAQTYSTSIQWAISDLTQGIRFFRVIATR